jgi:hypothetical protein
MLISDCLGDCVLHETWSGGWFESGVREGVNISATGLSHKVQHF